MGNTDIVGRLRCQMPTQKNTTEHSTIFDDVFRTIAQKDAAASYSADQ